MSRVGSPVPVFRAIDAEAVRAREAAREWRTFVCLLEADTTNPHVEAAHAQLLAELAKDPATPRDRGRFHLITRAQLKDVAATSSGMAQALAVIMERDRIDGIATKQHRYLHSQQGQPEAAAPDEPEPWSGLHAPSGGEADEGDQTEPDHGGGGEKEQQQAQQQRQQEQQERRIEARAAQLLADRGERDAAPDSIYVLSGFPANEAEAAALLEPAFSLSKGRQAGASMCLLDAVLWLVSGGDGTDDAALAEDTGSCVERADRRVEAAASSEIQGNGAMSYQDAAMGAAAADPAKPSVDPMADLEACLAAPGLVGSLAAAHVRRGLPWQDLAFQQVHVPLPPAKQDAEGEMVTSSDGPRSKAAAPAPDAAVAAAVAVSTNLKSSQAVSTAGVKKNKNHKSAVAEVEPAPPLQPAPLPQPAPEEIMERFGNALSGVASAKCDFKAWSATVEVVPVPQRRPTGTSATVAAAAASSAGALLRSYTALATAVPDELASPATVLYCAVEAVLAHAESREARCLNLGLDLEGSRAAGDVVVLPAGAPPLAANAVLENGDATGLRLLQTARARVSDGLKPLDVRPLAAIERAMAARLQRPRLLGPGALPLKPRREEVELDSERTELLTFTSLSPGDVDRARQLEMFERLLDRADPGGGGGKYGGMGITDGSSTGSIGASFGGSSIGNSIKISSGSDTGDYGSSGGSDRWSFSDRCYREVLEPHVLRQVFLAENALRPRYFRALYEPTDELLLACHRRTPPGRVEIVRWGDGTNRRGGGGIEGPRIRGRAAFRDWLQSRPEKNANYTPRTLYAVGTVMDIAEQDLDRLHHTTLRLFPSDHSVITVTCSPHAGTWLSATGTDGNIFGLQPREQPPSLGLAALLKRGTARRETRNSRQGTSPDSRRVSGQRTSADAAASKRASSSASVASVSLAALAATKAASRKASKLPGIGAGQQPVPPWLADFSAGWADGMRLVVAQGPAAADNTKPDKLGTVTITAALPSGLVVTLLSNAAVRQRRHVDTPPPPAKAAVSSPTEIELHRTIVAKGTVVRALQGGARQMLFATGEALLLAADGSCRLTDKRGRCFERAPLLKGQPSKRGAATATDGPWRLLPQAQWVATREALDVGSGAVCWLRDDGTSTTCFPTGEILTRHADGTVQRVSEAPSKAANAICSGRVLVETPGFASVEVNVAADAAAAAHAQGAKGLPNGSDGDGGGGGGGIRSVVALPNGAVLLAAYDTRCTAKVCGTVAYVGADKTEVIAGEDGRIVVRPRRLWEGTPLAALPHLAGSGQVPSRAEPDRLVGSYRFDLVGGFLETEDFERNRFKVGISHRPSSGAASAAAASPAAEVAAAAVAEFGAEIDLAGQAAGLAATAVVNAPIPPRLFVCRRDGSATELLRGTDVLAWEHRLAEWDPAKVTRLEPRRLLGDPADLGATLHCHHLLLPEPRPRGGDGLMEDVCRRDGPGLAALLGGDGSGGSFLSQASTALGHSSTGSCGSSSWRSRPLPLCAARHARIGPSSSGHSYGGIGTVAVRRALEERLPLSPSGRRELRGAIIAWQAWRRARAEQVNCYATQETRSEADLAAEAAAAALVRRAYRAAKAQRRRQRELEKAAAAAAARAASLGEATEPGGAAASAGVNKAALESIVELDGGADGHDSSDDERRDDDSEESWSGGGSGSDSDGGGGNGDDHSERTRLYAEVSEAFEAADEGRRGWLDPSGLRAALVAVLQRSVKREEALRRLYALHHRAFPGTERAAPDDLMRLVHVFRHAPVHTAGAVAAADVVADESPAPAASVTGAYWKVATGIAAGRQLETGPTAAW